jgi:iron complex outermembrane recepter protein
MAKYEDYSKNGVDYDGNYIPRVPKNTWNVAIHYHPQAGFFGRVDFVGIGGRYWESNNEKKADQYMLINARLGYAWQHIEVYAWAKNITNKEYSYNAFNSNGQLMGMPGDRRVIGGGVTGTF